MRPSRERDPRSDEALIQAANGGDSDAFEALYYRYRDWVVRLAHRWTRDGDDALDVLQETFAYLLGKMPRLRLTCRMTTFLYPVVRNLSLRSRPKKNIVSLKDEDFPEIADPASSNENLERRDLTRVMSALPEEQREILLLRFVDGLKLDEIAELLAIPLGTVKSRLHYAIAALRRHPRTRRYFEVTDEATSRPAPDPRCDFI